MTKNVEHIVAQINFHAEDLKSVVKEQLENHLSREQAIKRIRDINNTKSVEHLSYPVKNWMLNSCELGAINELMAIFDIKESEL